MKNIAIYAVLLLLLQACNPMPNGWGPWYKPRFWHMKGAPQYPADNPYQMGFRDGCQTHTTISAGGLQRSLPTRVDGWKLTGRDSSVTNVELYRTGFDDGREHCLYYHDK